MAVAPKPKKTAAQAKAATAFAAAGRAAQAATRAAAIKKTGKPPPVSKARHQAALKWAAAGRASQAAAKAGKKVAKKKVAAVAPELLQAHPGAQWPVGCNDTDPTCAAVAVACHLQAVTGFTMSNKDILKLHRLAGGETGATISDVLEAMQEHWASFSKGRVRLLSFFQTDEQFIVAGLVVGVQLGHEGHAVLSCPGGMITWGRYLPWAGEPREAWAIEWGL
jgi:hypothetical protein